jgi:hypothetical protein
MAKTQSDPEVVNGEVFGPAPPQPGRRRYYTVEEKRRFVEEARAPGSGVSAVARTEALVKTLRRDYVYLCRLDSSEVVLAQLPRWIDDYNDVHPHKGLKMRSPREYLRASAGKNQ